MIKYNLKCKHKHEFESWFSDSKEFEKLKSKKMIECIFCKTKSIDKSLMAPNVLSQEQKQENQINQPENEGKEQEDQINQPEEKKEE